MSERKLPSEWESIFRIKVVNADGWRGESAPSWDTPISRDEWNTRMAVSTCDFSQWAGTK